MLIGGPEIVKRVLQKQNIFENIWVYVFLYIVYFIYYYLDQIHLKLVWHGSH